MLRKVIVLAVSLLVLAGSITGPALAASRRSRTETANYTAAGVNGLLGLGWEGNNVGTVWFPAGTERYISVQVADDRGQVVWGRVAQDLDGDDYPDITHDFCGSTDRAVRIQPRVEVAVVLYNGVCPVDNSPSFATAGTVTGTFSNKK